MARCNATVTPLLTHWRYCSLAPKPSIQRKSKLISVFCNGVKSSAILEMVTFSSCHSTWSRRWQRLNDIYTDSCNDSCLGTPSYYPSQLFLFCDFLLWYSPGGNITAMAHATNVMRLQILFLKVKCISMLFIVVSALVYEKPNIPWTVLNSLVNNYRPTSLNCVFFNCCENCRLAI